MRLSALIPLLAAGGLFAAEGASVDKTDVSMLGHTLTPTYNIGKGTNWNINPMVVVGGGYDSNAFLTIPSKAQGSATVRGAIGLEVSTKPTDLDLVSFNGTFDYVDYTDVSNRNAITGSAGGEYTHEDERTVADVAAQWSRLDDPLLTTGALTLRDLFVADADVGYRVADNVYSVGVNGVYNDYLEATPGFTAEDRDSGTYTGFVKAAHEQGEDSKVYVKLSGGAVRPRQDIVLNSANLYSGVVGAEGKIGARSGWNIEFGQEVRNYSDDFNNDAAYDDKSVSAPVGRMGAKWSWIEGSYAAISGFSILADGVTSNASRLTGSAADIRYGLGATDIALLAFGSATQSIDSGAAAGQQVTNRVTVSGGGGVDWLIKPGIDLLIKGNYTNSEVNVGTSWERVQATGEIGMVF